MAGTIATPVSRRSWTTYAPLVVWLLIFLAPVPDGLNSGQWHYFAIFAAVIAGLIFESMPPGAVGIIGLTSATVFRYVDPDPAKSLKWALSGFSENSVWLIVGAFIFSIGYRKSGLGRRIALTLVRALGKKTLGLGYAIAFADLILAPATPSNTARSGGTIFPILRNVPQLYGSEPGPTAKRIGTYLMWTAFASTAVTSSMFLTALAPNVAALAIAKKLTGVDITWSQWFIGFLPLGALLLLLVPLLAYVICRPEVTSSPEISDWAGRELQLMGPWSRNERVMSALVVLAMTLWITGANPAFSLPIVGSNWIQATTVVFVIISLLLVTRVISFEDIVAEKSAWEVFFYFTSLLTLSAGLNEIGVVAWAANAFARPLTGVSPTTALILLVTLFFWIHYAFSSITSHATAVLPVVLAVGTAIPGLPMRTLAMLCLYSLGLMGVISPYATGPAPMYFGSGYIERRAFWRFGLIFGMTYFAGMLLILPAWLGTLT